MSACVVFTMSGVAARAHPQEHKLFVIQNQALSNALMQFSVTSGRDVLFSPELVDGRTSPGISGSYSDEKALELLLDGSGLSFDLTLSGALVIRRQAPFIRAATASGALAEPTSAPSRQVHVEEGGRIDEVVVTGSLITRNGYEAPTPVTVISARQFETSATVSLADALNRLPELSGSVAPSTSINSVSQGTAGLNNLNLRGLGPSRTLVLLDGERLVGSSFDKTFNNSGAVDINMIPTGLVKRVDIVTGGASAAYGSDAVAGVVNFVLDHDFVGFKADIGGGISGYGDNKTVQGKATFGTNFANGAGHILAYGSFSKSGQVLGDARPFKARGYNLVPNLAYTPTNGLPQYVAVDNVGLATAAPGGVISSGPLAGIAFGPGGTPYHLQGTQTGLYLVGGSWEDTRIDKIPSIAPNLQLRNLFTRVSYALNDSFELFGQVHWASSRTRQNAGLSSTYLGNLTIASSNPFIPESIRAAMTAAGVTSLPYGMTLIGGHGIGIDNNRIFRRFSGGFDGKFSMFSSDWTWKASYEYSKAGLSNRALNDPINANLRQAIASITGPNGAPVCSNTAGECVPFNPFGVGVNSQAAINFVTGTGYQYVSLTQNAAALQLNGAPFSIWAGPISFALGVDWRSEAVGGRSSALDQAAAFNYGNYQISTGRYTVTEGFLEAVIPLASEVPWAQNLDLNSAVRATSYSTSGFVTTWKTGLTFQPIADLRFRVSRSRDIRAANLAELFTAGSFGLPSFRDPFNGNAQVVAQSASSGNPNLKPEIADTTGGGIVLSPRFLPNFQASIDYYHIDIEGAIQTVGGQIYIDLCFQGQAQYCQFFTRNAAGQINLVRSTGANVAYVRENGLDIEATYQLPVSNLISSWDGDVTFRFLGTRVFKYTTSSLGMVTNGAGTSALGSGGLGAPSFRANTSVSYDLNAVSATLTMRYISSGVINNAYVACTSGCPTSTAINPTVNANAVPSHMLFDAAFNYKLRDNTNLYLAIDNVANKSPPLIPGSFATGYLFGQANLGYDRIGRMFRGGVRFKM